MASTIFSDSWFQVSSLRVALLPSVEVRQQTFRGKPWYVLQDTYTQRYFRGSEKVCKFILSLVPSKTVEEIWEDFVNHHPEDAPSQEEVIQILSQLHLSNLLYSQDLPDSETIVTRYKKQKNKELLGKITSFLYLRVPLWNPNHLLDRSHRLIRAMTGRVALTVWILVVLAGLFTVIGHKDSLLDQTQGVLAVGNLPWLYLCLGILKLFHEAGHAFVCKRYGGEVRTFGLMFLLLTPLPYVDATSSWGFANRWHRIYVSFAGMAVEFFAAALACLIWAHTGPGLTNSLAFNVMLIGSVSSLLFNGNPLLRFDAYYMLSDYAEIPNLYQKAQQQWKYFGDRYLLGTLSAQTQATDQREWYWLTVYGLLSFVYLISVTLGISFFLLDQWLPLGLLVLAMTVFGKLISPIYQLLKHLHGSKTQANRKRAVSVTLAMGGLLVLLLAVIPFPYAIKANGILQTDLSSILYLQSPGQLDSLDVRHGDKVHKGQPIATLQNADVSAEVDALRHAQDELTVQMRQALHKAPHELASIQQQLDANDHHLTELQSQLARLKIVAEMDGEWVSPDLHESVGSWLPRGHVLGEVVDRTNFRFLAIVQQEQAEYIFNQAYRKVELRLAGQADLNVVLTDVRIIPYQSFKLPSAVLGWLGGGDIAVNTSDANGDKAKEGFFVLYAQVPHKNVPALVGLPGLSGVLRLEMPPAPLLVQGYRAAKQLVQKRYAL